MSSPDTGEIILLNKPLGWTSFQAVKKIKYLFRLKKVGHAGTLDPLATGLLILCTGPFTKKIEGIQAMEKEYTGIITLGNTTPSYDLETPFDGEFDYSHVDEKLLNEVLPQFRGVIEQAPPLYSAIKIEGKRAYDMARSGVVHEMKKRATTIHSFEIEKIDLPHLHFRVVCSKGTYIRSLAYDLGKALHTGAHLSSLQRTRIGEFLLENAKTPGDLELEFKGVN